MSNQPATQIQYASRMVLPVFILKENGQENRKRDAPHAVVSAAASVACQGNLALPVPAMCVHVHKNSQTKLGCAG